MNEEQETVLNEVHKLATSDDHLLVPYKFVELEMAKFVINNLEAKLNQIADLVQVALGERRHEMKENPVTRISVNHQAGSSYVAIYRKNEKMPRNHFGVGLKSLRRLNRYVDELQKKDCDCDICLHEYGWAINVQ